MAKRVICSLFIISPPHILYSNLSLTLLTCLWLSTKGSPYQVNQLGLVQTVWQKTPNNRGLNKTGDNLAFMYNKTGGRQPGEGRELCSGSFYLVCTTFSR